MRVWRIGLWRTKSTIISWDGSFYNDCNCDDLSRDMTKPTKWLCVQRRLRSAWASAQSDQSLRCPHEESLGPQLPLSALRRVDAQADLSLHWAHTHFVGFVISWLIWIKFPCLYSLYSMTEYFHFYMIHFYYIMTCNVKYLFTGDIWWGSLFKRGHSGQFCEGAERGSSQVLQGQCSLQTFWCLWWTWRSSTIQVVVQCTGKANFSEKHL